MPACQSSSSNSNHPRAPRIPIKRIKIRWTDAGADLYRNHVCPALERLRTLWLDSTSMTSISVLIHTTNDVLNKYAMATNKYSESRLPSKPKKKQKPLILINCEKVLYRSHKLLRNTPLDSPLYSRVSSAHKEKKRQHARVLRYCRNLQSLSRDRILNSISSSNPRKAFHSIRNLKSSGVAKINRLKVGNTVYEGEAVPDGIYENIKNLKTEPTHLDPTSDLPDFTQEYLHILDICKAGKKIPPPQQKQSSRNFGFYT